MTERPRCTPPPPPTTQPPWMLTPPRSAEKLMRALSIDPFTSNDEARTSIVSDYDNEPDYFTYLQQITGSTYRDPPLPSAPPRQTPLFLNDEEDDDIQMGTDNRMVLFQSTDIPDPDTTLAKRPHEEDDDIEFTGAILPPDGIAYLGPPVKRRRRVKQEKSAETEEEQHGDVEEDQLQEVDETLREVEPLQRGCQACGCFCNTVGAAPKRSGIGSTTLSPQVLGTLLHMLMGGGHSLLSIASRMYPGIQTWADIAEKVGARREDFDRVRHAASGMQQTLPQKKARGEF